jgi:ABC-type antimicrobial peptide transport system permease subunit
LRRELQGLDAELPILSAKTMADHRYRSLTEWSVRAGATMFTTFGVLALLLATIGVYGLKAYDVARRTREIGIRIALGADRRTVLLMVLKEVAVLAGLGVALGLPSGYGLGRLVETQLFGLSAKDPLTFTVATVTLLVAAAIAASVPAMRATRVEPMTALRYE